MKKMKRAILADCDLPKFSELNNKLRSADISITDGCVIRVTRSEARTEENKYRDFDLNRKILPPNSLYSYPVPLSTRPDFVGALLFGLDAFLARTKSESHTRTHRIGTIVQDIVMFFEALWMRNVTSVDLINPNHFKSIFRCFKRGGWPEVLKILERAEKVGITEATWVTIIRHRKEIELISTNYISVSSYLTVAFEAKETTDAERAPESVCSVSKIRSWCASANLLFEAGQEFGIGAYPFPNPYALSKKWGREPSRTKNFDIGMAGRLFRLSMIWLYERGPLLLALVEELVAAVEKSSSRTTRHIPGEIVKSFTESSNRRALEALLPFRLECLDASRGGYSLRSVITGLMSSCFVLIAFMNARRKCEVSHRKLGLMMGSLKTINCEMGLYQVDFYIAKGSGRRLPFYVNETTAQAISILDKLQAMFLRVDKELTTRFGTIFERDKIPLFSYRRFSEAYGIGRDLIWFDLTSYARGQDASYFVKEAFGDERFTFGSTQVFRRMYGLVFYYRYENGNIVAACQQFGHVDLRTTRIYLTDPTSRPDTESIYSLMPTEAEDCRRAFMEEMKDLDKVLRTVGETKLAEEVFDILAGEKFSGGFANYVRRIHVKFSHTVSFSGARLGEEVFEAVKRRGHFPRPMPHGECMLGGNEHVHNARCFSRERGYAQQENASPELCRDCRFHLTKKAYRDNLQGCKERLAIEVRSNNYSGFELRRKQRELSNLEKAIAELSKRLGLEYDE
ncbi:hypothetical protein [Paraburkholderia kirstenboschensis]|uniref:Integrase n=1 Tax=Paraburkholderia kirstenboschensis TaxID=1245436 RepID=A0ABZ0EM64_9BURK|nr:hypothetical protein [Paraburkholderia kirstenboschensis]WOD18267.1 hypothetical protein RW095_36525 [Paraburkholderia kirstenboschensis]